MKKAFYIICMSIITLCVCWYVYYNTIHKSIEERNNAKIDCRKEIIDSCSNVGWCNYNNAEYLYDYNSKSCLYTYNYHDDRNWDFYVITDASVGKIIYWCTVDFNKNTSEESYSSNQESNNTDDCKKRYEKAKNSFSNKRETIR